MLKYTLTLNHFLKNARSSLKHSKLATLVQTYTHGSISSASVPPPY